MREHAGMWVGMRNVGEGLLGMRVWGLDCGKHGNPQGAVRSLRLHGRPGPNQHNASKSSSRRHTHHSLTPCPKPTSVRGTGGGGLGEGELDLGGGALQIFACMEQDTGRHHSTNKVGTCELGPVFSVSACATCVKIRDDSVSCYCCWAILLGAGVTV